MKSLHNIMPAVAVGTLALAALAGIPGQATAAVELNMAGSSAGKQFATDVPLDLCDAAPLPTKYVSADGNKIVWACHRTAASDDIVIRYNATKSADGITTIQQDISQAASQFDELDHTLAGCGTATLQTRTGDGKQYNQRTGCPNTNLTHVPIHVGASDVQGGSFNQTGGGAPPALPLDDQTGITSAKVVVVPWAIFVGKNVVNPDGSPITGLSRYQVEAIFNRATQARDWRNLGYATNVGGSIEGTSPITTCHRFPGSGSKAGFDLMVMINLNETGTQPGSGPGQAVFADSSGGIADCLKNNPRGIAYIDADFELNFITSGNARFGDAYMVTLEGYKPQVNGKIHLKCGRYPYWSFWRLNRRTADVNANAASNVLAQAFIDDASAAATIGIIPTGAYWASDEEMFVDKNADKGPIIWKNAPHPACAF